MLDKALVVSRCLMYLSATAMFAVLSYQASGISARLDRWETAIAVPIQARDKQVSDVLGEVARVAKTGREFLDDSYYDAQSSSIKTAVVMTNVEEITTQIRDSLLPRMNNILTNTDALLLSATTVVKTMNEDAEKLGPEVLATTKSLNNLLQTLEKEIHEGSPEVTKTAKQLTATLGTLDNLLSGDGSAILHNTANITNHTGEITESIDMALRPLREKKSLFRRILSVLLGMVKVTVPAI